ncbi:hypothetical protein K523DRAFT_356906 [Schizophyllum commune Tattone D]|nr:hypothetical protein K523DRAFT_356906 [Schizophyllum commune Tattone D]
MRCGYGDVQLDRCRPATSWELGFAARQRQARRQGVELPEAERFPRLPQEPSTPDAERYSRRLADLSVECPTSYRRPDVRVPVLPPAFLAMVERREQRYAAEDLGFDMDVQPRGRQRLVVTSPPSSRSASPDAVMPPTPASVPAALSSPHASPVAGALLFEVSVTPESSSPLLSPMTSPPDTPTLRSQFDWTPAGDFSAGHSFMREATFESSSIASVGASSPPSPVGELTPSGWISPWLADAMALPDLPQPVAREAPSACSWDAHMAINSLFFEFDYPPFCKYLLTPESRSRLPESLASLYAAGREVFTFPPLSPFSRYIWPLKVSDATAYFDVTTRADMFAAVAAAPSSPEAPLSPIHP